MLIILLSLPFVCADYWKDREDLIKKDQGHALGASIELDQLEIIVNDILMQLKLKEYDRGFKNPGEFLASKHFFEAKNLIEKSEVFKIIKKLPKGASLHVHDKSMVSGEFLLNLTYTPNLYGCTKLNKFHLHFSKQPNNFCDWKLLKELRNEDPNFDDTLKKHLFLIVDDPARTYATIDDVWNKFSEIFHFITPLLTYKPAFEAYVHQALKELYEDNVKYAEFRTALAGLHDANGDKSTSQDTLKFYKEIVDGFKEKHPDFIGIKLIYSGHRAVSNVTLKQYIEKAKELKKSFPDFIAGFDLVGQEELGEPLKVFVTKLQSVSKELDFFFHAGETDWYGSSTDLNLFDAILLGTRRIGHGYSLVKHPELLKEVKLRNIGIEICPISNQILKLVGDLRNHPGNMLMGQGAPVVICNDDPAMWGAVGLSYDWYLAFMGMSSRSADLRLLKQLALNSIKYSALNASEREHMLTEWENDWNFFLKTILNTYEHVLK